MSRAAGPAGRRPESPTAAITTRSNGQKRSGRRTLPSCRRRGSRSSPSASSPGRDCSRSRRPGMTGGCSASWICCTPTASPSTWRPPRRHPRRGWPGCTRRSVRSTPPAPGWRSAAGRPGAPVRRSSGSIRWIWSGGWRAASRIIPPSDVACLQRAGQPQRLLLLRCQRGSFPPLAGRPVRRHPHPQPIVGNGVLEPALLILRRDRRAVGDHRVRQSRATAGLASVLLGRPARPVPGGEGRAAGDLTGHPGDDEFHRGDGTGRSRAGSV